MVVVQFIKSYGAVTGERRFKIKIKLANSNVERSFSVWYYSTIYDIDNFCTEKHGSKVKLKEEEKLAKTIKIFVHIRDGCLTVHWSLL